MKLTLGHPGLLANQRRRRAHRGRVLPAPARAERDGLPRRVRTITWSSPTKRGQDRSGLKPATAGQDETGRSNAASASDRSSSVVFLLFSVFYHSLGTIL
jgi:hypothetical protein